MDGMDDAVRRAIEWDCSRLMLAFYDRFDNWDYEAMAAMFAEEGVWLRAGKRLVGRQSILDELSTRATTQVIRHVVTNLIVDVLDRQHARSSCYVTAWRYDDGRPRADPPVVRWPAMLVVVTAMLERRGACWQIAGKETRREFLFPEQG
ncbi:hypothetical protein PIGHUM_03847 [Pigmentiphaga humi]|uniref:SnoaL-like domain-containing protein n=1 Tax=Pigmentiphaga humi TaxID=2478468 RepID=A0A3P4B646_9BURK|nr:nuclear transport factor 2 family protein [Pigmentiphaga humi]VCU71757.1 hypothetical protein PIGHUM_03847 [Pigmentiphaga humi]